MRIVVQAGDPLQEPAPLLALGVFEDQALPAPLADLLEEGDFAARPKQTMLLYSRGALPARRVLLVGLGKRASLGADTLRQAAALAAQRARELKLTSYASDLPTGPQLDVPAAAQALAEGAQLGLYRYTRYKSSAGNDQERPIEQLTLAVAGDPGAAQQGVAVGEAVAAGVSLARDLANGPGNEITPARLAEAAQQLGEQQGLAVTVLGPDELRAQGFGGLLAVGQGSAQTPRFIILEYKPASAPAGGPTVVLVGKGITFDTGGISIKSAEKMDDMKMDMGGAAAVLGALHSVGLLELPIHVVGLISSAENMPSATAFKPGDIIRTLSGKTVEVLNTDAEGRIVLADALHYAQRYNPQGVIDLATLTGAIMVALGPHAIGAMGNDEQLMQRVLRAGEASAERAWQLPLWDEYREMVKSEIADVRNTGGSRFGGAITGAAFLDAFVGEAPWVHLDIAGTAWTESRPKAYMSRGATGIGVRLLVQLLRDWSNGEPIP
jgi:leucyl aminopeptidase